MQKLVVRAVRAESALEKADAMMPMVKNTRTACPIAPVAMKSGRSESPLAGRGVPVFA